MLENAQAVSQARTLAGPTTAHDGIVKVTAKEPSDAAGTVLSRVVVWPWVK
jgi:hypothetical protein